MEKFQKTTLSEKANFRIHTFCCHLCMLKNTYRGDYIYFGVKYDNMEGRIGDSAYIQGGGQRMNERAAEGPKHVIT